MKLTPYIPLRLQHFEIGKRTLLAVTLSCLTLLFLAILNVYRLPEPKAPLEAKEVKLIAAKALEPVTATPKVVSENKEDKKIYALSAILVPEALARRGLSPTEIEELQALCRSYVERYAQVAIAEKEKYGIPASITLAQALLESDAGQSRLARKNNNHFGIKCFSKKCKPGHCSNFSDDHHKDFFRKYISVWRSYRDHSQFLQKRRYRKCFEIPAQDYKGWARELSRAGYATDKKYADKLIEIIEAMDLWMFDAQT